MKRYSLPSLAILAMGWQVASATDLVYPSGPATPAATAEAEAPASQFAAQYTPLTPAATMPTPPSAVPATPAAATRPTTMPPAATAVPATPAAPASVAPAALHETPAAASPIMAAKPPQATATPPQATATPPQATATPPSEAASPIMTGGSPIMTGSSPIMAASGSTPVPTTLPAVSPVAPTTLPPVSVPTPPAAVSAPLPADTPLPGASKPTAPATAVVKPVQPAKPASTMTATPLPALMPPVKATPTTSQAAKPAPTTSKTTTVAKPTTTAAPLASQASTPKPVAKPTVNSAKTRAPVGTLREFLGIDEAEEPAAKPPVAAKSATLYESKKHTNTCHKEDFCFGCWCEGHLEQVRKQIGCCNSGCGGGGMNGDIIAGVTMYWIQPNFESNPAYIAIAGEQQVARVDYRHHLEFSPQIWIGYVGESGLGGRVTWWQFDRSSSTEAITVPADTFVVANGFLFGTLETGDSLVTGSNLAVNVFDFEATQDLRLQQWVLLASGGLRYAHMSQDSFTNIQLGNQGLAATTSHNFNGAGPTLALAARRLLGDSGLCLYGMSRGAVLFGSGKQRAYFTDPFDVGVVEFASAQSDVIPVVELELGAEYGRVVGNYRVFAQGGWVGQAWFGAGNAVGDAAFGELGLLASGDHGNLGFTGFYLRAGVGY